MRAFRPGHDILSIPVPIAPAHRPPGSAIEVLGAFLKLGLSSFGGPVAHLGYFRTEFVERRRWLDDRGYSDLVALCQFLPGPASSQVGMALGLGRAGWLGALAAWCGFTLPSAIALIVFAYGIAHWGALAGSGAVHGLKVAAVAVVAQAVWGMAKNLAPDAPRFTLAIAAAIITMIWPASVGQVAAILFGAIVGLVFLRAKQEEPHVPMRISLGKAAGVVSLLLFFALLFGLPVLEAAYPSQALAYFDSFYRAGSLVFGGGHVVLPLLQSQVVPPGWVSNDAFLAGYGAAQAVPGPLFTFAAYLGAIMGPEPNGWRGAALCLIAIFLPAFLLVIGVLPFWDDLRRFRAVRSALTGVNAAVVGLLLAALYSPVWTSGILAPADFALGLAAFALLVFWKAPPWFVVIMSAIAGWALGASAYAATPDDTSPRIAWQKVTLGTSGSAYPFALYSNYPLDTPPKTIESAVVIQHGLARNGDVYFTDAEKLLAQGGTDARATLVISPQFFATEDGAKAADPAIPLWSRGGWMEGADSIGGRRGVSSFRVYDDLVALLTDRSRFPMLERIVFAGHSGGAQVVHRYAILSHIDEKVRAAGIDLRFVVANPSSYLYFTKDRPAGEAYAPYDTAVCANYNRYKYGFEGTVPYTEGASAEQLFKAYAARNVVYLLGTADNDPNHRALDKRCAAEAQGRTRIERGLAYVRYERLLADERVTLRHRAYEVLGIGHDQAGMFGSRCGAEALFGARMAGTKGAACVEVERK